MYDFETPGAESLKTSKYNSAADQLQRIGGLWKDANMHARMLNFDAWNLDLDTVWRELAGDLKVNSDQRKKYFDFVVEILKLGQLATPTSRGFNKGASKQILDNRSKQYIILMQKEIFLRMLQNKLGKGSAYRDEFEDDFE